MDTHFPLESPRYGFKKGEEFYRPTTSEVWAEFFHRLNFIANRKNWLPALQIIVSFGLLIPFWIFVTHHPSFSLILCAVAYGVLLNIHGTVYLHRFGAHRAFEMRGPISLFILRNLTIKIVPEEIFTISHQVHHRMTEKPGDPYNSLGGRLYCFLADVNHQPIRRDLNETQFARLAEVLAHEGIRPCTYSQYQRWGTISHPGRTIAHYLLNWSFWSAIFYAIGGPGLVLAIFSACGVWVFSLRNFNYQAHGEGVAQHRDGIEFNRNDLSLNRSFAGFSAGEWHNNHHLFPSSACAGFLPYQFDVSYQFIRLMHSIGMVTKYRNDQARFQTEVLRASPSPQ